jgi:hypothetical protein
MPSGSADVVAAVMVIVADADFVLSVTEVAVTVTEPPLGTADGAVYVVAVPVVVLAGLKLPQAPALPQVTDHATCGLAELSLLTTAVSACWALVCSEAGGAALNATLIEFVVVLELLLQATRAAIMVRLVKSRANFRNVIAHLRWKRPSQLETEKLAYDLVWSA